MLTFGDAKSFGDLLDKNLNGAIKSSVASPTGQGYYMVASDGGVFAFGDAKFRGSMGAVKLNQPVESLVPNRDGSATGWSPPTAGSSPSAPPRSGARWATRSSTSRWWAWSATAPAT